MTIDASMLQAVLAGLALLLAAGLSALFLRGRAALAAIVLLWVWAAFAQRIGLLPSGPAGLPRLEAVLLGAPLLIGALTLRRETVLRSALAASVIAALLALSVAAWLAPASWWDRAFDIERLTARVLAEPFARLTLPAPGVSALLALLASLVAIARAWRDDDVVLLGVAAAVLAAGWLGYGVLLGLPPWPALGAAGAALCAAAARASYRMAFLDALTGLPTRRMLDERMARLGRRWSVAMVDVDHFKKFNDTHGHDVGDQVLKLVAASLRRHFGADAYRYGGEEFSVLFVGARTASAEAACDAFREEIAARELVLRTAPRPPKATKAAKDKGRRGGGKRGAAAKRGAVSVTVSIGLAQRTARRWRPEVVLKAADVALYAAKEGGRNRVSVDASAD